MSYTCYVCFLSPLFFIFISGLCLLKYSSPDNNARFSLIFISDCCWKDSWKIFVQATSKFWRDSGVPCFWNSATASAMTTSSSFLNRGFRSRPYDDSRMELVGLGRFNILCNIARQTSYFCTMPRTAIWAWRWIASKLSNNRIWDSDKVTTLTIVVFCVGLLNYPIVFSL